jgi:ATP-dependent Clp protease ATP-binding subunit ClpC
MLEHFTDQARKVMALAHYEAQQYRHEQIDTGHVLLALLVEGHGIAVSALKHLGASLPGVRAQVEKLEPPRPGGKELLKIPHAMDVSRLLAFVGKEAERLGHNHVGTELLLLGLLHDRDCIAAQVLVRLGFDLDRAREEVMDLLDAGKEQGTD